MKKYSIFRLKEFLWKNTLCKMNIHHGAYYCIYCDKDIFIDGTKILHFISSFCIMHKGSDKAYLMLGGKALTEITEHEAKHKYILDILEDYLRGRKHDNTNEG